MFANGDNVYNGTDVANSVDHHQGRHRPMKTHDRERMATDIAEYELTLMPWMEVCELARKYLIQSYAEKATERLRSHWETIFSDGSTNPQGGPDCAQRSPEELYGVPFN